MILKHYELNKKIEKNINFYLLYGPNSGLIEETIDNTLKPKFSKNIYRYDESEILADSDGFKERVLNKSFFANDKLIIISRTSDKIINVIQEVIGKKIEDIKIILQSDNLEKKSKLRNFFEKSQDAIIVPYYEDNNQTLLLLAQNFFKEKKIKISNQSIGYIIERSKGNRINLKNELEKISNYSHKKLSINLEEIVKLTNLAENYSVTELVDSCLSKNKKKTLNILNENNYSLEDCILIIRTFLTKSKRLLKLSEEIKDKRDVEGAISSFKPPIFWKDKEIIKLQIKNSSYKSIKNLIFKINETEFLIKKNSSNSINILANFIIEESSISNS